MLEFAAAVFFLIITPGPGVLSTAGVGAAYGMRAGLSYVGGLWIGTNLVALMVISGLAAAAFAIPWLRAVLLWASVGYLLFLAARIALAGSRIAFIQPEAAPGVWNGVTLQAINPKAYTVNTTFFSGFAFLPEAPQTEMLLKLIVMNAIWLPIHLAWLWAGVRVRAMELAPGTQRAVNVAMATSMLAVVALAARAQL